MKKNKIIALLLGLTLAATITGCQNKQEEIVDDIGGDDIVYVIDEENTSPQSQYDFEKTYVKAKLDYTTRKLAISVISNFGSILAGALSSNPVAVVAGISGLVGLINDALSGQSGPTLATVMNKLNEMDEEIGHINDKLDANTQLLSSLAIYTDAKIDQALCDQQEKSIEAFNDNYLVPIENYKRNLSDYYDQSFKSYVSAPEVADFYIYQNSDSSWSLSTSLDSTSATKTEITFNIDSFKNSQEFLSKNNNAISKGFMDNLYQDIDEALEDVDLPKGLEKTDCRDYLCAHLNEEFTKTYFVNNHQQALDIRNYAINIANQISGKNTTSILERYTNRLKYMYNFASEMDEPYTAILSNLMLELDSTVALASEACLFAEVNSDEIKSSYIDARNLIQSYDSAFSKLNTNYSFITDTVLDSGFYRAKFNTSYTNKGNHPTFNSSFTLHKVYAYMMYACRCNVTYRSDDINNHNIISAEDTVRIATRMNVMKKQGLIYTNSFTEYLNHANIINDTDFGSYNNLLKGNWISNDGNRFLTGLSFRSMNDNDKNFTLQCNEAGNPGGDYFSVGWKGTFRSQKDSEYWSGTIAETTFIDGSTGSYMSDKRVCAYANYDEGHTLWVDDEHWSFVDNPSGNYFFILESVNN